MSQPRATRWVPSHLGWILLIGLLAVTVVAALLGVRMGPGSPPLVMPLPTLSSPLEPAPTFDAQPPVHGPLHADGGPFLRDSAGRNVFLHGVNVVYKHPPFEVYPDPGKPWNFTAADASLMARLGFNVVRLGMTWRGLEPGTAPANDPSICRLGKPEDPHQFNQSVLERYLRRLRETVDILGHYGIYSILDMHQDVYNEMFDGEGAPNWAVCTDGVPSTDPPGRWSSEYATAAAGIAYDHFWKNNVVGNLQGQFDMIWSKVAAFFRNDPWVAGYDPFNEPFSTSLLRFGDEHFDVQLECFYTGRTHPGETNYGARVSCPPSDPSEGVIPTILASDPHHLIFDEPDNFASRGYPIFAGPMNFPNLVYNVHIYCGARSPTTGNPTNIATCVSQDVRSLARRAEDRPEMASPAQPAGPAWLISEFGATSNRALLSAFTSQANAHLVSWIYWSWRYYSDPTGSAAESLVMTNGRLRPTVRALSQTYPEAVAGRPTSIASDPTTGAFRLSYIPDHSVHDSTVIFVPMGVHFLTGYCASITGGKLAVRANGELLEVQNDARSPSVSVTVTSGQCRVDTPERSAHEGGPQWTERITRFFSPQRRSG